MKNSIKEFCKNYRITEDQFFGKEKIGGYLDRGSLTSIPEDSEILKLSAREALECSMLDLLTTEEVECLKKQYSESKLICCENCRSLEEPCYSVYQQQTFMDPEIGENICIDCGEEYQPDKLTLHEFYIKTK